jgi:hypothetical protein
MTIHFELWRLGKMVEYAHSTQMPCHTLILLSKGTP